MTRRAPPLLLLLATLVLAVSACGPVAGKSGTTAVAASVSSAAGAGTHPGAPGPDPNGGGTGQAGARPGAPYDIEAFENEGGSLDGFRGSYRSEQGCRTPPGERCHVVEHITGDDSDPSACTVDSISYAPQPVPPVWPPGGPRGKIQEGTIITAVITCPAAAGSSSSADATASTSPGT